MSKTKQNYGICIGCEEPTPKSLLSIGGYCPECEIKAMESWYEEQTRRANMSADFDEIDGKRISAAKHNNANADVLSQMFAYFI